MHILSCALVLLFVFLVGFNCYPESNIGQYDCCPLVWKPLIPTSSGLVIPPDAIEIGRRNGDRIYYARIPLELSDDPGYVATPGIGIKTSVNNSEVAFLMEDGSDTFFYREGCLRKAGQSVCVQKMNYQVVILSNPHGCTIGWWKRKLNGKIPSDSSDIFFPMIRRQYFARFTQEETNNTWGGVIDVAAKDFRRAMEVDEAYIKSFSPGPEVLFINCHDSIKRIFEAELYNMTYEDMDKVLGGSGQTVLESSNIINNVNTSQSMEACMTTEISHSLQASSERATSNSTGSSGSEKTSTSETRSWSVSFKISVTVGFSFFGSATVGVDNGFDKSSSNTDKKSRGSSWESKVETFAKTGKMTVDTFKTSYSFNQLVAVPPRSSTVVSIVTNPVKGTVGYTAKYRIKNPAKGIMPWENTLAALKRIGISDVDRMTQEGEDLIMIERGKLSIETGYNTHVDITSTSLDKDSNWDVKNLKLYPFGNK